MGKTSRHAAHPTLMQYTVYLCTHKHTDNKHKVQRHTQLSPWLREKKAALCLSFAGNISAASAKPERNTDNFTHIETTHNEQVTEPLFPNRTFIFPLYIGSDKASNASFLHLCIKSGNFWNTFAQMLPTYFSWKKQSQYSTRRYEVRLEKWYSISIVSKYKYIKSVTILEHVSTCFLLVPAVC